MCVCVCVCLDRECVCGGKKKMVRRAALALYSLFPPFFPKPGKLGSGCAEDCKLTPTGQFLDKHDISVGYVVLE